ncbi:MULTISPECIES: hypothetical protein [Lactiplantibacillus]|uniref:hypothetical protein n=1 Tax=Lactiplantibacillus TaxID=2767842 RepID=UPI001C1FBF7B|nr:MULTISPECIES: hypothetical protein [Lactiplantibacillus]MBU7448993.1 hypothetical protein [Lactiplantibacillus sp. 7.2.4]MBU7481430.1 hypothetical protein [Lactiplantibacillus pentosus]MBU7504025.1 hypothetical protein [Lactiplantibacillus pentosus]MDY1544412.1 hypothetical protein [Lactiplantibacillus pentosus]
MNISKKSIIGVIIGIVVIVIAVIALKPHGLQGTYTSTTDDWKTDTIVFDGKNYKETVVTKVNWLGTKKTYRDKYSGTFNVKDNEVTFEGKTANGPTAKLSKDKKVLSIQNGQQLIKKE